MKRETKIALLAAICLFPLYAEGFNGMPEKIGQLTSYKGSPAYAVGCRLISESPRGRIWADSIGDYANVYYTLGDTVHVLSYFPNATKFEGIRTDDAGSFKINCEDYFDFYSYKSGETVIYSTEHSHRLCQS